MVSLAEDPARYPEYAALSRVAVPAVAALSHEIARDFPEVRTNDFAKQAIGAFVGNVMRQFGHTIVRRGRVPGDVFSYGSVWSALPTEQVRTPG
ncbi:hypothetical protein D3227_34720 [Mesorhizobium waimense]|uniref:Uncharacterized protein n=1 Tax=Mesorhizobium waimense TaxID=1300307 RepID=A0A3A5K1F4_9HYPH|nr:hypothetical protein D3227_34720 [Mesorhizobium waimense]